MLGCGFGPDHLEATLGQDFGVTKGKIEARCEDSTKTEWSGRTQRRTKKMLETSQNNFLEKCSIVNMVQECKHNLKIRKFEIWESDIFFVLLEMHDSQIYFVKKVRSL